MSLSLISSRTGELGERIQELTAAYRRLWAESVSSRPLFKKQYTHHRRREIEGGHRCIQQHFPVRFSYLKKFRNNIQKKLIQGRKAIIEFSPVSAFLLTVVSRTLLD